MVREGIQTPEGMQGSMITGMTSVGTGARSSTCLTDFVDELLEYICCFPSLDHKDVVSLSSTCHRMHRITRSNNIWSGKWRCRWTTIQLTDKNNDHQKAFKDAYLLERCLVQKLEALSTSAFDYVEVPHRFLHDFDKMYDGKEMLHLMSELLYLLASGTTRRDKCDLNQRYYATKVYQYVCHQKLKQEWDDLLRSDLQHSTHLERGALLISQWCNPMRRVCSNEFSSEVDRIVSRVQEKMDVSRPKKDVDVVKIINEVLYGEFGFKDNTEEYYDVNNSFIDQVIRSKKGIPITLSVLYITIASRLGLDLHGVNFPGHFLIRLTTTKDDGQTENLYIDAFHRGEMMNEDGCISRLLSNIQFTPQTHWTNEMLFQDASYRKIFIRMVGNIINIQKEKVAMNSRNLSSLRSAHELMAILAPYDRDNIIILSKIDEHLRLDVKFESLHAPIPKLRSSVENSCVKYKVGGLMRHRRYNYMCVVYGWDSVCRMDDAWKAQMSVHRLDEKDEQPFYHVLAHDGSSRYAAQENLLPVDVLEGNIPVFGPISHPEIGRYFECFDVLHCCYVSCVRLREMYPED